jgi:hypothetical protein
MTHTSDCDVLDVGLSCISVLIGEGETEGRRVRGENREGRKIPDLESA